MQASFTTLKILHQTWVVEPVKTTMMQDNEGWSCWDTNTIYYNEAQIEENLRDTLLHEILHVLNRMLELDDHPEDEEICTRLTPGLLTVARDNPKEMKWIMGL